MGVLPTHAAPQEQGLDPGKDEAWMKTQDAVSAGDVVAVDVDTFVNGRWSEVRDPVTADLAYGVFMVAQTDVAASAWGMFTLRGAIDAQTTGTPLAGAALSGTNAANTLGAIGANEKVIAYAAETGTSSPTAVVFDGWSGFGFNET